MEKEEIKGIRKKLGLTQVDFAKKINTSLSAVQTWEKGTRNPSKESIERITQLVNEASQYILIDKQYVEDDSRFLKLSIEDFSKVVIDYEEALLKSNVFKYWLTTKIQKGIIESQQKELYEKDKILSKLYNKGFINEKNLKKELKDLKQYFKNNFLK